ncbi:hypothetical protein B0H13DRAFT_2331016 [Mycena leptocephala]|nr:hypothetical protein B0H13DRAFT_2331016 [Mycena leptocephala]
MAMVLDILHGFWMSLMNAIEFITKGAIKAIFLPALANMGFRDPLPAYDDPFPVTVALPVSGDPLPVSSDPFLDPLLVNDDPVPVNGDPVPVNGDPLPAKGDRFPAYGDPLPVKGDPLLQTATLFL